MSTQVCKLISAKRNLTEAAGSIIPQPLACPAVLYRVVRGENRGLGSREPRECCVSVIIVNVLHRSFHLTVDRDAPDKEL